jgi:hypothetical protein
MRANYEKEINIPSFFWEILNQQTSKLGELQNIFEKDEISPLEIGSKS